MDKLNVLLFLSFIFIKDARVTAGFKGSARASLTLNDGTQDQLAYHHNQQDLHDGGQKDPTFPLRIQVKDVASQQPVSYASVEVFANYTLVNSTITGRDGVTVLRVPYTHDWPLTLVARKDGYIQTPLLWKTTKIPIFSSVTLPLFYQNQGNIWLFEDLVIITGKTSDTAPPANVQFPKRLLSLPDGNISSLKAYLTAPRLPVEKHFFHNTTGIIMSSSGYRSFELNPVAAVCVQLLYNGTEVQISGPVQITLPLTESSQSQLSYTVPAWSFDRTTGAWVNRGLGTVRIENRHLVWVYTASHLDYWMAAPFPLSTGYMGHKSTLDFISYNAYLLVPVVGGALVVAVGLLAVVSCYCRESLCKRKRKRVHGRRRASQKKEQTPGRNDSSDRLDDALKGPTPPERTRRSAASQSRSACKSNGLEVKRKRSTILRKTGRAEIGIRENPGSFPSNNASELVIPVSLHESQRLPETLSVLYNQSVALIRDPHQVISSARGSGSRSATLPRKAVQCGGLDKAENEQMALRSKVQQQTTYGETREKGWKCLLESVSVPDILSKATGMDASHGTHQGSSEQTLLELSRSKPLPHPKAWFVSLEGKPAAQVCHSVLDLRKCHLLLSGNQGASLDSGVDLNEQHRKLNQRGNTARTRAACSEDADLSSCESGTILLHKNTHRTGRASVSYLPEEKCDDDDDDALYKRSECVPSPRVQALRNTREKPKSTWNLREERPLMQLN